MIKDIINPQSTGGMSAFFGLEKQRWDILYQQSVDIFNKHIEESNGTFNKHILVERLVALGETENEQAYLLYSAGEFIGELTFKVDNPIVAAILRTSR
jgi:hypothetical protein